MHHPSTPVVAGIVSLLACLVASSRADDLADKGRDIFRKNQRAVVTVQVVVKMKFSVPGMGGQANESRQDVTGTVVDPSGLTVLALSSCEPGDMIQSMMAGASEEDTKFKMETELSDIKLLLDDGTEIPAEIVLRDKDLDLAFLRPKTRPSGPMTAVDLTKSAAAQVLLLLIGDALDRLGLDFRAGQGGQQQPGEDGDDGDDDQELDEGERKMIFGRHVPRLQEWNSPLK